jgi:hypothetical protein
MRAMPKLPPVGPETKERYEALAEDLVARGATRSQMFGMPVLKKGDKVFCGTFGDAMTFKLGSEEAATAAMKKQGVEFFEPMAGRKMKAWVLVPVGHWRTWAKLADQAFGALP